MADVRLTATNPSDSSVVPVACNDKGELKLEEPIEVVGPQGPKGDRGEPGQDGADGADGAPGQNGADGADGDPFTGNFAGDVTFTGDVNFGSTTSQSFFNHIGSYRIEGASQNRFSGFQAIAARNSDETQFYAGFIDFRNKAGTAYSSLIAYSYPDNTSYLYLTLSNNSRDEPDDRHTSLAIANNGFVAFGGTNGTKCGFLPSGSLWITDDRGKCWKTTFISNGIMQWQEIANPSRVLKEAPLP